MQVTTDVLGTVQFQTSKSDVWIRLSILDQEKEVASNTGKGRSIIPAFVFLAYEGEQLMQLSIPLTQSSCCLVRVISSVSGHLTGSSIFHGNRMIIHVLRAIFTAHPLSIQILVSDFSPIVPLLILLSPLLLLLKPWKCRQCVTYHDTLLHALVPKYQP